MIKNDFILLHDPHSLPSHLAHADKFIIISNCGSTHNPFDNYDPHYQKYDKWKREIHKYNKWCLWKRNKFNLDEFKELLKKSITKDN